MTTRIDLTKALRTPHLCDCDRCSADWNEYEDQVYRLGDFIGASWFLVSELHAIVFSDWHDAAMEVPLDAQSFAQAPLTDEAPGDDVWFRIAIVHELEECGWRLRRLDYKRRDHHPIFGILNEVGEHVGWCVPLRRRLVPELCANYREPAVGGEPPC